MILPITPNFQPFTRASQNEKHNSTVMYSNRKGLSTDIISFTANKKLQKNENKTVDSMKDAVPRALAMDVNNEVADADKRIYSTLKKYLKPLVASVSSPNNPILPGINGIKHRVKEDISICEKTATRDDVNTRKDILTMGDLMGFRIVLSDNSQKSVDKVLKQLGEAVKSCDLNIIEIENYVLPDGRSYASIKALEKLADVAGLDKENDCNFHKHIKSGYPAIHIGIRSKEGYVGEIQIMGKDVEDVKDLDDWFYKILDNKHLAKKYKPAEVKIKKAIDSLSPEYLNMFMQYRRDSFTRAFDIEPKGYNTRKKSQFIDIPYFLPQELGYQWVADQKFYLDTCNAKHK